MTTALWDSIDVGDTLPELSVPITWKFLTMAASATQDFMPYHHHPTFPQTLGMRGPFINTMSFQGLFGRVATDCAGPESRFRSISLSMLDQCVPGDQATVTGVVVDKASTDVDDTVLLKLQLHNQIGLVAESEIVLAVPSARHPEPTFADLSEGEVPAPAEDMPIAAREMIGKPHVRSGNYPVSEAQIRYWAETFRDANPLYSSTVDSGAKDVPGIIAPPQSLLSWAMARGAQTGVDTDAPDIDAPELEPWPDPPAQNLSQSFRMPGADEVIVRRMAMDLGQPLTPGDVATVTSRLVGCSGVKDTKLGKGYFLSFEDVYQNQDGVVVGLTHMSLFNYGLK